MNRRTFLKTTAVVTTTPLLAFCENKPRVERVDPEKWKHAETGWVSKWIAFKDQMPEAQDKIDVKNMAFSEGEIHCGRMVMLAGESLMGAGEKIPYFYYRLADGADGTIRMVLASVGPDWHWRYVS